MKVGIGFQEQAESCGLLFTESQFGYLETALSGWQILFLLHPHLPGPENQRQSVALHRKFQNSCPCQNYTNRTGTLGKSVPFDFLGLQLSCREPGLVTPEGSSPAQLVANPLALGVRSSRCQVRLSEDSLAPARVKLAVPSQHCTGGYQTSEVTHHHPRPHGMLSCLLASLVVLCDPRMQGQQESWR